MIYLVKTLSAFILWAIVAVSARIHKLPLTDDVRPYVDLTTFGFFQGGILDVAMLNFKLPADTEPGEYGFTLDRTVNDAISPYLETHSDTCFLRASESSIISPQHPAIVFLKMDFKRLRLNITCKGNDLDALHLYQNRTLIPVDRIKRQSQYWFINKRASENVIQTGPDCQPLCSCALLPITKETRDGFDYYNTSFAMYVASVKEEGLYNLYFHNCPRTDRQVNTPAMNVLIEIYESNDGNFLSAGEMPLPALYSTMSLIFLLCAGFWTFILRTSKHPVYRIHILMCVLVYLKAMSLAFHGINYYFIRTRGEHVTAWAIIFYVTHLLKGAVLFVTIVLVGTGWNFIKHILNDRDKKLFMIVIPLQVVANVAEIIIAESEDGAAEHDAWRVIFIVVDLLCCVAILFPIVWSIRHLSYVRDDESTTNLRKLKLFRHFYIMVVCYIYFTRIIVYLLKITVPFQYSWIDEMSRELATLVFFAMTGYKFRPASANPYFTPSPVDDVALVISDIGVLEGVTKIPNRGENKRDREDMKPLIQDGYSSE